MSFLVVDDFPSARKQVRSMLVQMGVTNYFEAAHAGQAKKLLQEQKFDLVVCDYNLGDGQDGQQMLEELRNTGNASRLTQWIIITAETSRDMVMGAVENEPDDYLAKPFAYDAFKLRVEKLVKRRYELEDLLKAMDSGDHEAIIQACEETILNKPRHRGWARKVMISTLIDMGDLERADKHLEEVLNKRQQDWALFYKARIQMLNKQIDPAITLLREVISTNPNNIPAYDSLAKCYLSHKQYDLAQQTLQQAVRISPRKLERQRMLAELSRRQQDHMQATKAYREALALAVNTRHDQPANYINLIESLNLSARMGTERQHRKASRQAMEVAQRMMVRFPDDMSVQLKSRLLQSDALDYQGLTSSRDEELDKVYKQAMQHIESVPQTLATDIATGLYRFDKQIQGDEWVDALRKAHAKDEAFQQKLMMVQSEPVSEESRLRAAEFNKAGNDAYRDGDYEAALKAFSRALEFSPRHPGLILNMVQSYFKLYQAEPKSEYVFSMELYLKRLKHLPSSHYQYGRFQALLQRLLMLKEEI